jgi:hypothetical protein
MVWLNAAGNWLSGRASSEYSFGVGTEPGSPNSWRDNAEAAVSHRCPLPLNRSKAGWRITATSCKIFSPVHFGGQEYST